MGKILGIDLGTTNSCVAVVEGLSATGLPEVKVIPNSEGAGKGDTKMGQKLGAKDYTDAKVQEAMKDDAAFKAIKEGSKDKDGKTLMKPAEDLSDDDIKDLVKLVRSFKK
jgi:hypothetical protein